MKVCLVKILNTQLDKEKHLQSSLPVRFGGLGIRRATDLALPAFLASANGAGFGVQTLLDDLTISGCPYTELTEAKDCWKDRFNNNGVAPLPADRTIQAE